MLSVSAPFHSPLLSPAAETMTAAFETVSFNPLAVPVVSNVTARPVHEAADVPVLLVRQVTAMVRWRESVLHMASAGVDTLIEVGAGKVLTGLARRIDRSLSASAVGTVADVEALLETFGIGAAGSGSGEQHGMFDLSGKVALVTGASGGIGSAVAEALHAQGAAVALSGRRAEALEALAAKLGEGAHAVPCDLADRDALAALPERAAEALGAPAILVHCGGITRDGLALRMKDEDWQEVLEVNLSAGFVLARACLRGMIRQRWGRLIFITSVVGDDRQRRASELCSLQGRPRGHGEGARRRDGRARRHRQLRRPRFHRDGDDRRAWRTRRRRRCSAPSRPGDSAKGATLPPPASTSRAKRPATSPGRRSTSTAVWP